MPRETDAGSTRYTNSMARHGIYGRQWRELRTSAGMWCVHIGNAGLSSYRANYRGRFSPSQGTTITMVSDGADDFHLLQTRSHGASRSRSAWGENRLREHSATFLPLLPISLLRASRDRFPCTETVGGRGEPLVGVFAIAATVPQRAPLVGPQNPLRRDFPIEALSGVSP